MDTQKTRTLLIFSLLFVGFMLFQAWQEERAATLPSVAPKSSLITDIPEVPVTSSSQDTVPSYDKKVETNSYSKKRLIQVETDVFSLSIDKKGGDIVALTLPKYPESLETPDIGMAYLVLMMNISILRNQVC